MMSSPSHVAREAQASTPGVTPQLPIVESTIGVPPAGSSHQVVASLTSVSPVCQSATEVVSSTTSLPCVVNVPSMAVTVSVTPAALPSMPKVDSRGIANEPLQESGQAKFLTSPGYIVPPPPLPYNVLPLVNSASGSTQQSSSSPALQLPPSVSAPTLQPPVPGQMLGYRPSFSYNITSHANSSSSTGQQFQPTIGSGHLQGGRFTPTMNAASLQPPVPGQLIRSSSSVPGMISPNVSQIWMPPPIPRGSVPALGIVPAPTNFSFSGSSRPAAASEKTLSSNISKSDIVSADAGMSSAASHSSRSTNLTASPCMNSTSMLLPTVLPNPIHSGMSVSAAKPGQLGMSNSASFSLNGTTASIDVGSSLSLGQTMPAPVSVSTNPVPVSVPQNIQQQVYAPHASVLGPPQAPWLHHSQHGGVQRAPFPTFPGGFPAAIPIRAMPLPSVPLQPVQPPGVSNAVIHGGSFPINSSFSDPGSNLATKSPFPDTDRLANDLSKDGGNLKNEQEDAWTSHKTETGVIYYYNSHTGQSTYERPLNFKGEVISKQPEKVDGQPTPVSWEKLDGTDWSLVTTNDGKKYYYDTKNRVSSWQLPSEVAELRRNQDSDSVKGNPAQVQNASLMSDKVSAPVSLSVPALQTGGRESTVLRTSAAPASSSALDLIKKKLQDAGVPAGCSPLPASSVPPTSDLNGSRVEAAVKGSQSTNSKDKVRDVNGDGNVSDSSSDSDDAESGPSKEEFIIQFKEMLKERGVAPFSKWDKELPKIVFDPRFKAVPGYSTRRALFEQFVRTRAEEVRKEERAAQKAALDGFRQLLEEASEDIDHRSDYETFKRKWGNDPRFMALKRREQEFLLNEKILPLKKAAEDKMQAIRMAAVSSFKSMLHERQDISPNSRWSRVKESVRNDPRYKSVKHEDREVLFNEYISELKASKEELEQAAKLKKDEQEKLKERERELRKRKEREEQEMERVRLKIRKKEAVTSYQALLVETIKDPKATWTESKLKLEKDPQGRATNPDLGQADAEKLFREHVKDLFERCVRDFRTLLVQVITPEAAAQTADDGKTVLNSWSEAKRLLKPDPRYSKMPGKEREPLWSRHAEDVLRKQKATSSDQKEKQEGEGKIRSATDYSRRSPRRSHGRR